MVLILCTPPGKGIRCRSMYSDTTSERRPSVMSDTPFKVSSTVCACSKIQPARNAKNADMLNLFLIRAVRDSGWDILIGERRFSLGVESLRKNYSKKSNYFLSALASSFAGASASASGASASAAFAAFLAGAFFSAAGAAASLSRSAASASRSPSVVFSSVGI